MAQGGSPVPAFAIPDELFYTIIDGLDEVAAETGKTVAQIALNWLLQRPTVSTIIIGARTEEQLKQNLDAAGWNLTTQQVKKLDRASEVPAIYPLLASAAEPHPESPAPILLNPMIQFVRVDHILICIPEGTTAQATGILRERTGPDRNSG